MSIVTLFRKLQELEMEILRLISFISSSWSFPKRVTIDILMRSLDSIIAITFCCHCLLKHLSTLLMRSSLGSIFPNDVGWITIWVNLFYIYCMVSYWFILNSSYSYVRVFILNLLTSVVPSWVLVMYPTFLLHFYK